jgi:hypothetical protein
LKNFQPGAALTGEDEDNRRKRKSFIESSELSARTLLVGVVLVIAGDLGTKASSAFSLCRLFDLLNSVSALMGVERTRVKGFVDGLSPFDKCTQ